MIILPVRLMVGNREVVKMLCFRVTVNGSFVGLFNKDDRVILRGLLKRFGISHLSLVPVILL